MVNVLDCSVMTALMSASCNSDMSRLAAGVAKTAGSEAAAERAMGYAMSHGSKALTAAERVKEALAERVEEVREEEKLAQQQELETRAGAAAAHGAARVTASAAPVASQPTITLELSQDYMDYVQSGTATDAAPAQDGTLQPANPVRPVQGGQSSPSDMAVQMPVITSSKIVPASSAAIYRVVSLDLKA